MTPNGTVRVNDDASGTARRGARGQARYLDAHRSDRQYDRFVVTFVDGANVPFYRRDLTWLTPEEAEMSLGDLAAYDQARHRDDRAILNLGRAEGPAPAPKIPAIGLVGYARSGKDTVAGSLFRFGYGKVAFGDGVRRVVAAMNPLISTEEGTIRYCDYLSARGYDAAKSHPEVRRLLQAAGTEAGRMIHGESVWVDMAIRNGEALRTEGKVPVYTDVRFENEMDAVRASGGVIWYVRRPGIAPPNDHASEDLARKVNDDHRLADAVIYNTAGFNDLYKFVEGKLADLIGADRLAELRQDS
jgi:hypothetical protein